MAVFPCKEAIVAAALFTPVLVWSEAFKGAVFPVRVLIIACADIVGFLVRSRASKFLVTVLAEFQAANTAAALLSFCIKLELSPNNFLTLSGILFHSFRCCLVSYIASNPWLLSITNFFCAGVIWFH